MNYAQPSVDWWKEHVFVYLVIEHIGFHTILSSIVLRTVVTKSKKTARILFVFFIQIVGFQPNKLTSNSN